jgi:hypothetical protein
MLFTISLSFTSFTWLWNFLALSISPNFLFTTENVVSAIFLWLYLVLSKLRCNCFLYFPPIFSLFLCLKGIIESVLIISYYRMCFLWIIHFIFHITSDLLILFDCLIKAFACLISWSVFWLIFHPNITFSLVSTDIEVFRKLLRSFLVLRE